mmetsp:Transcript_35497/g.54307  ORF Transcript_35497/g.54307 Transcript_35497/m.54307 type:complete len:104 (+) Transcript_35497:839-1150(+)
MIKNLVYPVRAVAAEQGTTVFMIHRRDFHKLFSAKDKMKIVDLMSTVEFPKHSEVIREIDIFRQVHKIKRQSFMDSCDTNLLARDMRDSVIDDPKLLKRVKWV